MAPAQSDSSVLLLHLWLFFLFSLSSHSFSSTLSSICSLTSQFLPFHPPPDLLLHISLLFICPLLTCQSLSEIGHFFWFIKAVSHLYQGVHVLNHQFLTGRGKQEVRWAIKITFRWELTRREVVAVSDLSLGSELQQLPLLTSIIGVKVRELDAVQQNKVISSNRCVWSGCTSLTRWIKSIKVLVDAFHKT